ncbi:unnamed protein product, partial [Adineta steineri]
MQLICENENNASYRTIA